MNSAIESTMRSDSLFMWCWKRDGKCTLVWPMLLWKSNKYYIFSVCACSLNIKQTNTMQLGNDLYYCTSWLLYMFRAPLAPIIRSITTLYAVSGSSHTVRYNSFLSDTIKVCVRSWYSYNYLLVVNFFGGVWCMEPWKPNYLLVKISIISCD